MSMLCQVCGGKTRVLDTIGANTFAKHRRVLKSNVGVLRLRCCAEGHQFETIEIRKMAYDALVGAV